MNGRRTVTYLGTLALAAALLSSTSLTSFADQAAPQAAPAAGAPSAGDLDAILKQTQAPGAPAPQAGAPAAPDAGGAPPAPPAAADNGGQSPAAPAGAAAPPAPALAAPAPAAAAQAPAPAAPPPPAAATAAPPPASGEEAPLAGNIQVPADPVAKAAFDALDKHCARCHQDGMLMHVKAPQKNFGDVLQFDKLAADPNFVVPGNPDASKIVQKILNKEMPADYWSGSSLDATPVSGEELTAIRNWITQLGSAQVACTHPFVTEQQMVHEMAADLSALDKTRIADTRYITLTHLYNACSSPEEMDVYRKAVVKLLNSLSHSSDVVRVETIDKEGTIVRFNLKDLGWQPTDWDKILAVYPYAARPDDPAFDLVSQQTLTPLPYIRGDFFAFAASRPPLYYSLLNLPDTFQALQQKLGVNVDQDIASFNVKRAGFQNSGVSRNNRMIERHQISTGYLWNSYDFAGDKNDERQNFFEFPLGPGDGPHAFKHQGGEMIFSLPNGFQAYYLAKASGERLDVGPNVIVQDLKQRDYSVHEGISCMSCHDQGIKFNKDEVRDHILADRTFDKGVRDAVTALFPPVDDMMKVLQSDRMRFLTAEAAAGLAATDAQGNIVYKDGAPVMPYLNGADEMVYSLSKRYEDSAGLPLVAAEFGESADDFIKSVEGSADPIAVRLGRRLQQGTKVVPRDVVESEFKEIMPHVTDLLAVDLSALTKVAVQIPTTKPPAVAGESFDLAVVSDKSSYTAADHPVFTITPAHDCFLQLIDVDDYGKSTLLFPNAFDKNNLLKGGQDFKFPPDGAKYRFRFTTPGTETVTASCSVDSKPVDGVKLDVKSRGFTDLGDHEKLLTRSIELEAAPPATPAATAAAVPAPGVAAVPQVAPIARSAIKLSVK